MNDMAEPNGEAAAPVDGKAERRAKRSHAHRFGLWTMALVLNLFTIALILAVLLVDQTMRAPQWLRVMIEERVERSLGGLEIAFGDVDFVVNKGWRPRVRLRDVVLSEATGRVIVELADIEASLALRPLLNGKVQPKQIELTGAFATLRRDRSGRFSLLLADPAAPVREAAGLAQMVEQSGQVLRQPQLAALTGVKLNALSLRYEDALQGRAWTLDGGSILLQRDGDTLELSSQFSILSGRDYASAVEINYSGRIGSAEGEFGFVMTDVPAQDLAAQAVPLGWLNVLDAPISGALRGGVESDGALRPLSATLQIGAGALKPTDETKPIPFDGARSYFTYDPAEHLLQFDELSVENRWVSGAAEGRAYLGAVDNGRLSDLVGQLKLTRLRFAPGGVSPEALTLDGSSADFRLALDPFHLTLGEMLVTDQTSHARLWGRLDAVEQGWALDLDGHLDRIEPDRVMAVWPEIAIPKARRWVAANVLAGDFRDFDFALRARPGAKPDVYFDFEFSKARISFLPDMPVIEDAAGQATMIGGRLAVMATGGTVEPEAGGKLTVAGTSFVIPDLTVKQDTPAIVDIRTSGSVTAVMALINREPLNVLKNTSLPIDMAEGQVEIAGQLRLPLKPKARFDEFDIAFTGEIRDVSSTVLVPGHVVTSERITVDVTSDQVELAGRGLVSGVPANVVWRQPLGVGVSKASVLTGTAELSPAAVEAFRIGLPAGSVRGVGKGEIRLDLVPGKAPELTLSSDLTGVGLSIPQLGWSKRAAATGALSLRAILGNSVRVEDLSLDAAGLSARGRVLNRASGGLDRAVFTSLKVGSWLNSSAELIGRGADAPAIRLSGGRMDMRTAAFGTGSSGSGGGQSSPLSVQLDRLQITDTIAVTGFAGQFATAGGLEGTFTGRVNGQTAISGTVIPKGGRSAVRVVSADGGGVARAAGILEQGQGGDFTMELVPVGQAGEFDGTLKVLNTRVKDAPAIAALLNAISLVGLFNELAGQGILFSEVNARFRLSPTRVTLYEGSAVGPSIGLSMDGIYRSDRDRLNMRGVITPVYMLNGVGSILTRRGEGLFAFSYRLKGPADDPSVTVNPLSALAPGVFREIFRGPAPEDPSKPRRSGTRPRGSAPAER